MAKTLFEIRSMARSHTTTALNVLVGVMRNTKASDAAGADRRRQRDTGSRMGQGYAADRERR
jgi:hypothetical protein